MRKKEKQNRQGKTNLVKPYLRGEDKVRNMAAMLPSYNELALI